MSQSVKLLLEQGLEFHQRGALAEAGQCYQSVLSSEPDFADAHHLLGVIALQSGNPELAIEKIMQAVTLKPNSSVFLSNLAEAYVANKNYGQALFTYKQAIALEPNCPELNNNYGVTLKEFGQLNDAKRCFRRAVALKPRYSDAYNNLGNVLRSLDSPEEAIVAYQKAIQYDPENDLAPCNLAELYEKQHRLEEALALVVPVLDKQPNHLRANLLRALLHFRQKQFDEAKALYQKILTMPLGATEANQAHAMLGLVDDKLGCYDKAYAEFSRANDLSRDYLSVASSTANDSLTDPMLEDYQTWAESVESIQVPKYVTSITPKPLFLVGFPRSGTSLFGQVLAAHSQLHTLDESPLLTDAFVGLLQSPKKISAKAGDQLSERIMQYASMRTPMMPKASNKYKAIVDKMPLNLVYLPFLLSCFPTSKVIVLLRDPRDVVMSCFMQNFTPNLAMSHFFTLEETVAYYLKIMGLYLTYREKQADHWLEVQYESVVQHPEEELSALMENLELPWEGSMLAHSKQDLSLKDRIPSYRQINEPLYTHSIGRWRHYRKQIGPYLASLAPLVHAFGYEIE